MAKQFLRVANDWIKLREPVDNDSFFVNVTGHTIRMYTCSEELTDTSTINPIKTFPVGGSIAQFHADNNLYVYGKAMVDANVDLTSSYLLMDDSRITWPDSPVSRDLFSEAMVQLMHLTKRTTKEEIRSVKNKYDHYDMQKELRKHAGVLNVSIAQLHRVIMDIQRQLLDYQFERSKDREFIAEVKAQYQAFEYLKMRLSKLQASFEIADMAHYRTEASLNQHITDILAMILDQSHEMQRFRSDCNEALALSRNSFEISGRLENEFQYFLQQFHIAERTVNQFKDVYRILQESIEKAEAQHYEDFTNLSRQVLENSIQIYNHYRQSDQRFAEIAGIANDTRAMTTSKINSFEARVIEVIQQVATVSSHLEHLEEVAEQLRTDMDQIQNADADRIAEIVRETLGTHLQDLQNEIDTVDQSLTSLQNAITSFAATATPEDLDAAFANLLENATTDEQRAVLTALKDHLAAVMQNTSDIRTLEGEMVHKLDERDQHMLEGMSLEDLPSKTLEDIVATVDEATADNAVLVE